MTTTAAIYARLSQDKTRGTAREGESLESQVRGCTEWIESRGWTVGTIYRDNDVSATSGAARPAFEQMLKDAPEIVVYRHQDRLERGMGDLDRFLMAGCEGYATDGSRATLASASGELMTRLQSLISRHEGRIKAERIKAASLRNAEAGRYRGTIRPFGQTITGEWVMGEAEAVREAAQDIAEGKATFWEIAHRWNEVGLKTPQTGKQGGREWTSGTVRNFFTRPRLMGHQEYEGVLYPLTDWTPLLDRATWEAIQLVIASKRTGKRGKSRGRADAHLLTSILKCECGRGMNAGQRGAAGSTRLYRCPTAGHQTLAAEPVERAVGLHAVDLLTMYGGSQQGQGGKGNRLREAVAKKAALIAEYQDWSIKAIKALLDPEMMSRAAHEHVKAVSAVDAEILSLREDLTIEIFSADYEDNLEGWNQMPRHHRREILSTLYTSVTVRRAGQGKRFSPDQLTYAYTDLGDRLHDDMIGFRQWQDDTRPVAFKLHS